MGHLPDRAAVRRPDPMGQVMRYMGQTGLDAQKGADILRYRAGRVQLDRRRTRRRRSAASLKGIAQVKLAGLGTRVFYTPHGSFDTHANQLHDPRASSGGRSPRRSPRSSPTCAQHDAADDVIMLLWTEFGRRVKDNGAGTDHGAGGHGLRDRRAGQGRHVRRVPLAEGGRPDDRQPQARQSTSARPTPRSWSAGSRSTRSRSSAAASSSSRSCRGDEPS